MKSKAPKTRARLSAGHALEAFEVKGGAVLEFETVLALERCISYPSPSPSKRASCIDATALFRVLSAKPSEPFPCVLHVSVLHQPEPHISSLYLTSLSICTELFAA